MNLKLLLPIKKIKLNDNIISIPKLGIKHHMLLKGVNDPVEMLDLLSRDIKKGLTIAEYDIIILHILEFNGKIKNEVKYNGETLSLNDVYISQKLEFQYGGNIFKFKEPGRLLTATADMVLSEYYTGNQGDIDFLKMPAFVYQWVESMTNTVSIKTNTGIVSGLNNVIGIFNNGEEE